MEKKITLNDWLKKWFSLYSKPNVKHSTAVSYECYIRKHIIPEIGNVYMDNIDLDTLQNFFNTKSQELSPKSVSNIRMMMQALSTLWTLQISFHSIQSIPQERQSRQRKTLQSAM